VTTSKVGGFVYALIRPRGEGNDPDEVEKVEFNEKQQEKVNEIVEKRLAQERRQAASKFEELKTRFDTTMAELEEAKKVASKAKPGSKGKEDADSDVDALKAQLDELRGLVTAKGKEAEQYKKTVLDKEEEVKKFQLSERQLRKEVAINAAAGKINFFDLEAVRVLTDKFVQWSDEHGKFIVIRPEDKQPRLNASLEPMTLEEFYSEYASKNPFLVRGDVKPGAGSSQSPLKPGGVRFELHEIFGPKSSAAKAVELKKSSPEAYKRMKQQAIEEGLIAG